MGDKLSFKVYISWDQDAIDPEIRRFEVEKSAASNFAFLSAKLAEVSPKLRGRTFTVSWKDEDDDYVVISSDDELRIALGQVWNAPSGFMKLYVQSISSDLSTDDEMPPRCGDGAQPTTEHFGVVCDACDNAVTGFRYKCTICDDFDLCSRCEAGGVHPDHCMVRIPVPSMPRTLLKAAVKRSRHILMAVAQSEDCPYKKNKRDRSHDKKHHRDHHHRGERDHHRGERDHHRGERDHHRERRECRRPRNGWLETFANYMNEFANLAGDIDLHPVNRNEPSTSNDKPTEVKVKPEISQTINEIQNAVNSYSLLAPLLTPSVVQPSAPQNDVEMGQGDRSDPVPEQSVPEKPVPEQLVPEQVVQERSVPAEISAADSADSSSDKVADDWTVINNNEKEATYTNLPQEFQRRVIINEGGEAALYPQLNLATAVLNTTQVPPTEGQSGSAKADANKERSPQPEAKAKPAQPAPERRARHPIPHVEVALQHMLAMGFNNEGGWLTQLLESNNGDIAAVLELLTPVTPKRK